MKKPHAIFLLTLGAGLLLVACEEDAPPPPPPAPAAKKAEPAPAASAATPDGGTPAAVAAAAPFIYSYNPVAKRDPFRSPMDEAQKAGVGDGPSLCNEPLCQWDIDQVTLVAVVTGDANPLAMVEDPQGTGHIVRNNSKMGKQGGKVTKILRDSVTVTEYWRGPDGKVVANPVMLHLKGEQKKAQPANLLGGKDFP